MARGVEARAPSPAPLVTPPDFEDEVVRAAGGVVLAAAGTDGDPEVLLVHRPRYDDWSLPKGKCDPGESYEDCARREVRGGDRASPPSSASRCPTVRYEDHKGRPKVVRYWVMRPAEDAGPFVPNDEVDEIALVPARRRRGAAHATTTTVISWPRSASNLIPRMDVFVVRHAKAGSRRRFDGDDTLRPLSRNGRPQAEALVELLAHRAASTARAHEPVHALRRRPSSRSPQALGLEVEIDDDLAEGADWTHALAARRAARTHRSCSAATATSSVTSCTTSPTRGVAARRRPHREGLDLGAPGRGAATS